MHKCEAKEAIMREQNACDAGTDGAHSKPGCGRTLGCAIGHQKAAAEQRRKIPGLLQRTEKNLRAIAVEGTSALRQKRILDRGQRLGVVVQHGCEEARRDGELSHG